MSLRTAVIIATKGRPQEVSNLLGALEHQTALADLIIVSACDPTDIAQGRALPANVEVIYGPAGLPAQRNRALALLRGKCDIVVFFDDDFVPSRYWLEQIQLLFATHADVVSVTGKVLVDGVVAGMLDWREGQRLVDDADRSRKLAAHDYSLQSHHFPYGCNMAFRVSSIEHLTFDERLVLYGWLEDRDFAVRAGSKMVRTDALWGVHLGATRGRTSGLSFGYSQVVNPWYLATKGTMTSFDVLRNVIRALAGNTFGSLLIDPRVDRLGRLKGNVIALRDIVSGQWAPEKAAGL